MSQILYVLQGLPGAGKSSLAQSLKFSLEKAIVCSTDDYFFVNEEGVYNFVPEKLVQYHMANIQQAKLGMDNGYNVIIDNTNIKRWNAREYVRYAVAKDIPVVFIRVTGPVQFKSVHGVPQDTIIAMQLDMEDLDVTSVLASKCPWEVA